MYIKKISRSISIMALFLVPIVPLIVMNGFFFPFITGKAFLFRLLVEIAFGSYLILAFADAKYRPRINYITVGVTVFAFVTLIADLFGANPIRSMWSNFERMEGWITIVHLWAFFIVATSLFSGEDGKRLWHRWMYASLGVAFFIGMYGLCQILGAFEIHQGSTRVDATLGNAAYMAVYMLINIGIALYLLAERKVARWNFKVDFGAVWPFIVSFFGIAVLVLIASLFQHFAGYEGVSALYLAHKLTFIFVTFGLLVFTVLVLVYPLYILPIFFTYLLYETATRGTLLGLVGGIMLALFLYAILAGTHNKKSRIVSASVLGGIIILGLLFWFNRNASFVQNNETLRRMASISWEDTKTQARAYIWPMALKGWTERPILGWGQENFNYIFNANYDPRMWSQEQWFDRAHSVYLDWLVAGGLVGFVSYISLYVLLLLGIWKMPREDHHRKSHFTMAEKVILTGLVVGYAIHNVFVFDNLASYVLFFALLAFIASIRNRYNENHPVLFGKREFSVESTEYVVAPITIIAFIVLVYFFQIRPLNANTRLITALRSCQQTTPDATLFDSALDVGAYVANQEIREQILSCAGGIISGRQYAGPTKMSYYSLANKAIEDQIAAAPKDARMYVLGGMFMNAVGQSAQALPLLEKAHLLSPRKQTVDLELAQSYLSTGQLEKSVDLLEQAYNLDTTYDGARILLAISLVLSGQESKAHELFGDNPDIFKIEQMGAVYASIKQFDKAISIYQDLMKKDKNNINYVSGLVQVEIAAGRKWQAIEILRKAKEDFPLYKDQIEAAIKSLQ
ncbi:MAG: O-antigen ligase family protein [Patescibacteria group bacterium]|nr:O-antigen ligase family protein [Patescibacteria group bacterium]